MPFTAEQKQRIREYMGSAPLYRQYDPALESAMTTIENLDDGGATTARVISLLALLADVESKLQGAWCSPEVASANKVSLDYVRGAGFMAMEGRRLVGRLADIFDYSPKRDVFSPRAPGGHPNFSAYGS